MTTSRHPTYRWTHPGRENPPQHPCPLCELFIGMVFAEADRAILPAHPHCDCAWESTQNELGLYDPVTWWHWSEMHEEVRWNFVLKVAWMLRQDPPEPVPPSLQPLIPEAEAYNRMREEEQQRAFSAVHLRTVHQDNPLQFRGRLIAAGEIRNVLDKPAGMLIPAHTLESAVTLGQFDNIACFIDHAGPFDGPSLRNLFGVWTDIYFNVAKQSVDGTLNIYDTQANRQIANIFAQALAPDQPSPDIGVSIVFYGDWQDTGQKRTLTRFHKIESADLVFMPASSASRILEALSAGLSTAASALNIQPVGAGPRTRPPSQGEHTMPEKTPTATPHRDAPKPKSSQAADSPSQLGRGPGVGHIRHPNPQKPK